MSYRRYFFHPTRTATCEACGQRVKLRGYNTLLGLAAIGIALLAAGILLIDSTLMFGVFAVALVAVFVVLDRWSWKTFLWDPIDADRAS